MIEQCRLECRSEICVRRRDGAASLAAGAGEPADATADRPAAAAQGAFGPPGSNTLVSNCVPRDDTGDPRYIQLAIASVAQLPRHGKGGRGRSDPADGAPERISSGNGSGTSPRYDSRSERRSRQSQLDVAVIACRFWEGFSRIRIENNASMPCFPQLSTASLPFNNSDQTNSFHEDGAVPNSI
jgi:hypothetical protein